MTPPGPPDARTAELAANLAVLTARIEGAVVAAGRPSGSVTLVAVSKTWPASDVRRLAGLGVVHVGENRDQEAAPKAAELRDLPLVWHFVGQLQSNKARSVARYASVVESVDRLRLVPALDKAAASAGRRLQCLAQVCLDDRPGRGGVAPADLLDLAAALAAAEHLDLTGVMAVAPLDADPDPAFGRLAGLAAEVRARYPAATTLSAGMSADLESAIRHGATHVRVGSAVFGSRG